MSIILLVTNWLSKIRPEFKTLSSQSVWQLYHCSGIDVNLFDGFDTSDRPLLLQSKPGRWKEALLTQNFISGQLTYMLVNKVTSETCQNLSGHFSSFQSQLVNIGCYT